MAARLAILTEILSASERRTGRQAAASSLDRRGRAVGVSSTACAAAAGLSPGQCNIG